MKTTGLALSALVCLLLAFNITVSAQVSFFQPPTFAGSGYTLFVGDFNRDGKPDLLYSDGTMNLGNGDGSFTTGTKAPVPTTPSGFLVLAVADFNGDGKLDVLEQELSANSLLVYLGNGDGTFQTTPISSATGGVNLTLVSAIDLNGDGKADVVGVFNSTLLVYLSKGNGTFASGVPYNIGSLYPMLSFGDFNGDHKTDIVVSTGGTINNPVGQEIVFLGNGDGTFQAPRISVGVPSAFFGAAAVGDFNGDGHLDLYMNGYLLLGNGDGTFQPPTVTAGPNAYVMAADVNGDGKLDLVTSGGQVYWGKGDGSFSLSVAQYYAIGSVGGQGFAIADFNGDGKLDIASGNTVLLGNGDGTFQGIPLEPLAYASPYVGLVVGDFDKNGTEDVAVVSLGNISVLKNNGTGALSLAQSFSLVQASSTIVTADLNGDGNLDLFVVSNGPQIDFHWGYSVLLGNGDGTFQPPVFYLLPGGSGDQLDPNSVTVADFNNDGKFDIAISLSGPAGNSTLALLMGNGDGTFATPSYVSDGGGQYLVSADFNGDGKLDIAAGPGYDGTTALLLGNGDGTFKTAVSPPSLKNFGGGAGLFVADLNHDGNPDLIAGSVNGYQVALGNGDGTFTMLPVSVSTSNQVDAIADLNGDGKPDLVVTQWSITSPTAHTGVMLGNGDGTFGSFLDLLDGPSVNTVFPSAFQVADMNGDGLRDILFSWGGGGIGVLFNTTAKAVPDFTISSASGSSNSENVSAGQTARFDLLVTPQGTFGGMVNLSCAITPTVTSAPTCTLSAASLQIVSGTAQPITVSVSTAAPVTTSAVPYVVLPPGASPLFWTTMLLGSAFLWVRTRKRLPVLVAPMMVLTLVSLVSCAGSGSPISRTNGGTPAGTYTATLTANSGSLNHSMILTVVVQ